MASANNKQRTLGQIAVTRAWFDTVEGASPPRYSFMMDISFQNERLGGGPADPVRLRVGLKQCSVVVILPQGDAGIQIDERTVWSGAKPALVKIKRDTEASAEVTGSAHLDLGVMGFTAGANAKAAAKRSRTVQASTEELLPVLLGTRSQSKDGHQSWNIRRIDGTETLEGLLWDANEDVPRFQIVDRRTAEIRENDKRSSMQPSVTIEVRCKREDLEISDIELTDPADAKKMMSLINRPKALKVAEAYLKQQLQKERLRVGDIHEPFSELVVGDLLVSLVDDEDS